MIHMAYVPCIQSSKPIKSRDSIQKKNSLENVLGHINSEDNRPSLDIFGEKKYYEQKNKDNHQAFMNSI